MNDRRRGIFKGVFDLLLPSHEKPQILHSSISSYLACTPTRWDANTGLHEAGRQEPASL